MKNALWYRLFNYIRQWHSVDKNKWIHKDELVKLAQENGYNSENAVRRLRELSKTDEGEPKLLKKKCPWGKGTVYQYNPGGDPMLIINQETYARSTASSQTTI